MLPLPRSSAAVVVLGLLVSRPAGAAPPDVAEIFPAGGQRGTIVHARIVGSGLAGARVIVSGAGVAAAVEPGGEETGVGVRITIDGMADPGPHELRLASPSGVSGPVRFWVDSLPTLPTAGADAGPPAVSSAAGRNRDRVAHDAPSKGTAAAVASTSAPNGGASGAALPLGRDACAVDGHLTAAATVETYSFDAHASETWVFDCVAARICSPLDPLLTLRDSGGTLLRMAQAEWGHDPRLVFQAPREGRYTLGVTDTQYRGGPGYVYRLLAGRIPAPAGWLPLGGRPGEHLTLYADGANLGSGVPLAVAVPPDPRAGRGLTGTAPDSPVTTWVVPVGPFAPLPPLPVLISDYPVRRVADYALDTTITEIPCALDGRLLQGASRSFALRLHSGEPVALNLLADRIGSPVDGELTVRDPAGHVVATADDTIGRDPRIDYMAHAAGRYRVEVRSVDGSIGPDCVFRLIVRHPEPGFRAYLDVDRLTLARGETLPVTVHVERLDGFAGAAEIEATGLPPGVAFRGFPIGEGRSDEEVTFTAPSDASPGAEPIRLVTRARAGGRVVVRDVESRESYLPRSIDPGMFTDDSYRRPYRVCALLPLAVTTNVAHTTLACSQAEVRLASGGTATLAVAAAWLHADPKASAQVTVTVRGLPDGVAATTLKLSPAHPTGAITLTAGKVPATERNLILVGSAKDGAVYAPAMHLVVSE